MRAQAGDELTIKGVHQGDEDRHGTIVKVGGADGTPPYVVRWQDGHESVVFPAGGTVIQHHPAGSAD